MTYREGDEVPETNMRSFMCMRAFPYEVGGMAENVEAHRWLNAMRKDGWHLVSMSTSVGRIKVDAMSLGINQPNSRTIEGNIVTFVMEGTKPDHQRAEGQPDRLWPVEEALRNTQSYGHEQW